MCLEEKEKSKNLQQKLTKSTMLFKRDQDRKMKEKMNLQSQVAKLEKENREIIKDIKYLQKREEEFLNHLDLDELNLQTQRLFEPSEPPSQ